MENQLWNLFRATGDPRTYLLYRAGEEQEKRDRQRSAEKPEPPQEAPSSSL